MRRQYELQRPQTMQIMQGALVQKSLYEVFQFFTTHSKQSLHQCFKAAGMNTFQLAGKWQILICFCNAELITLKSFLIKLLPYFEQALT